MSLSIIERSFPVDDIAIRAGGSGRTVIAYAAIFDTSYGPIGDGLEGPGAYYEQIHRSAFNRAISHDPRRAICLFNHGFMTGTLQPSDRFSMPLGTPVEIRSDTRGLLTVTEYANTPLADEVLELIRAGAITSQSFRGPIYKSRPAGSRDGRRVVERMELGIRDYGPTATAINQDAAIVGVRSQALLEQIADLTDEERAELLVHLSDTPVEPAPAGTSTEPVVNPDTPPEPVIETPPAGPSDEARLREQAQRRRQAGL